MSKKQRVLEILLDFQPHNAYEFVSITYCFHDVFKRLREEGYKIDTLPLDGHNKAAWYQLIELPVAI